MRQRLEEELLRMKQTHAHHRGNIVIIDICIESIPYQLYVSI